MKIFTRLVLILIGASLFSCSSSKSDVVHSVNAELKLHPESHLVDLYKYFFQDYFGPGHLISDTARSRKYLDYELENSGSFENFDVQNLLYKKQFHRVNLSVLADGKVDKELFLEAFYKSAENFKIPDVQIWMEEWNDIYRHIQNMNLELIDFEKEAQQIDSVLNSGDYVVHHSTDYIDLYDPHYRIIYKDQFKILNLIAD